MIKDTLQPPNQLQPQNYYYYRRWTREGYDEPSISGPIFVESKFEQDYGPEALRVYWLYGNSVGNAPEKDVEKLRQGFIRDYGFDPVVLSRTRDFSDKIKILEENENYEDHF